MIIVAAMDKNGGIGYKGGLPWPKNKEDMSHFRRLTTNEYVLMGYNTYKSLDGSLPHRINIAIDKNIDLYEFTDEVVFVQSLEVIESALGDKKIFLIGGAKTFERALQLGVVSEMVITHIDGEYEADTFFNIPEGWTVTTSRKLNDNSTVKYYKKGN